MAVHLAVRPVDLQGTAVEAGECHRLNLGTRDNSSDCDAGFLWPEQDCPVQYTVGQPADAVAP
jgi:hypothetical protein